MDKSKRETLPSHLARAPTNIVSKSIKKALGLIKPYVGREREPDEVQSRPGDLWERPEYKSGDGDHTKQTPREGSLAAFNVASRGHKS
jgi:hypothetical protein